jgi:tripartite-type tricarboxylate transporter receptor subunit TctC
MLIFRRCHDRVTAFALAAIFACGIAAAQDFPSRTIRLVTSEPGSGTDFVARLMATGVGANVGKPVVVENRGGGILAVDAVLKSPADGYTLLLYGTSLWLSPFMRDNPPYDPVADFAPVTLAAVSPNLLVVHPSLGVDNVRDLIALLKSKPAQYNYASGSTGSPTHLAAELFKSMAGVELLRIPFKGTGPAINALLGGQVQVMIVSSSSVMPHVRAGKLKALAVSSAQPTALAPGLPTVSATGLPNYEAMSFFGVFVPGRTPVALINRLNAEILRVLSRADARERLFNSGLEYIGNTPQEFAALIKADMAKWGRLIKAVGIREE